MAFEQFIKKTNLQISNYGALSSGWVCGMLVLLWAFGQNRNSNAWTLKESDSRFTTDPLEISFKVVNSKKEIVFQNTELFSLRVTKRKKENSFYPSQV